MTRTTTAELDRQRAVRQERERLCLIVTQALVAEHGEDAVAIHDNDPFTVWVGDVQVCVGWDRNELRLRPTPKDAPALYYYDGDSVTRVDDDPRELQWFAHRERTLLLALLDVVRENLDAEQPT